MAKLYYQGHGSLRLTTAGGTVVYIDPFAGDGYDRLANLILVTHQHPDHNKIHLPPHAANCVIFQNTDAVRDGVYRSADIADIHIEAVEAYNRNHDRTACVGYLVRVDCVLLYFAGDTSTTAQMARLAERHIDYAFLPTDGIFNMDVAEAMSCAEQICAEHTVPIHMSPGKLFDEEKARSFRAKGSLIIRPGTEIEL